MKQVNQYKKQRIKTVDFLQSCSTIYLFLILDFLLDVLSDNESLTNALRLLPLLNASKALYQHRISIFSDFNIRLRVNPRYLTQIQHFNPFFIYIKGHMQYMNNDHIKIFKNMNKLKKLQLINFHSLVTLESISFESLTQLETLIFHGLSSDISLPQNLTSLSISGIYNHKVQIPFYHLKELKLFKSGSNDQKQCSINFNFFPALEILCFNDHKNIFSLYPRTLRILKTYRDHVFADIEHLSHLEVFKTNKLFVNSENTLSNLTSLTIREWYGNVDNLIGFTNLTRLKLFRSAEHSWINISALCQFQKLRCLRISGDIFPGFNASYIAKMPQLVIFSLKLNGYFHYHELRIELPTDFVKINSSKYQHEWRRVLNKQ